MTAKEGSPWPVRALTVLLVGLLLPALPPHAQQPAPPGLELRLSLTQRSDAFTAEQPVLFTCTFTNPSARAFDFGHPERVLSWRERPGFVIVPVERKATVTVNQLPLQDELWSDRQWLGPSFEPNVPVARVDMLRMWAPGPVRLRGQLTDFEGHLWISNEVELEVVEAPEDNPLAPLLQETGMTLERFARGLVSQFYYGGTSGDPKGQIARAADSLRQQADEARWRGWLEVVSGVDLLVRLRTSGVPEGLDKTPEELQQAFRTCERFEGQFADSPFLPQIRMQKAIWLARIGRQEEARALVRAERQRSPIALLLYDNLARIYAEPAALLREPG